MPAGQDGEPSLKQRAREAGVPSSTVRRWMSRGVLARDASAEEIKEFAADHWQRHHAPVKTAEPAGTAERREPRELPDEIREAVERGELRIFRATSPAERRRYGLAPLEDDDAGR